MEQGEFCSYQRLYITNLIFLEVVVNSFKILNPSEPKRPSDPTSV